MLASLGGLGLVETEGTWNLGVGMIAIVGADAADPAIAQLAASGIRAWQLGVVSIGDIPVDGWVQGAKGVDGGAVRLVGAHPA